MVGNIDAMDLGSTEDSKWVLFSHWLKCEGSASWDKLSAALDMTGNVAPAEAIREMYLCTGECAITSYQSCALAFISKYL